MKQIHKKIYPQHFAAVVAGQKHAELRKEDDIRFEVGDLLILEEWDPTEDTFCMSPGSVPIKHARGYTGRRVETWVTNVVRDREGLAPGWAMVSIERSYFVAQPSADVVTVPREEWTELLSLEAKARVMLNYKNWSEDRACAEMSMHEPIEKLDALRSTNHDAQDAGGEA